MTLWERERRNPRVNGRLLFFAFLLKQKHPLKKTLDWIKPTSKTLLNLTLLHYALHTTTLSNFLFSLNWRKQINNKERECMCESWVLWVPLLKFGFVMSASKTLIPRDFALHAPLSFSCIGCPCFERDVIGCET